MIKNKKETDNIVLEKKIRKNIRDLVWCFMTVWNNLSYEYLLINW